MLDTIGPQSPSVLHASCCIGWVALLELSAAPIVKLKMVGLTAGICEAKVVSCVCTADAEGMPWASDSTMRAWLPQLRVPVLLEDLKIEYAVSIAAGRLVLPLDVNPRTAAAVT